MTDNPGSCNGFRVRPDARTARTSETVEENLDPELLEIFLDEGTDIMAAIEESLTKWRAIATDRASVAELKRQLHTLKGGARMAGAMTMGDLGHHTESLLGEVESGRVHADTEMMDLLDEVHDALVTMIGQMQNHKPVSVFAATTAKVLARLGLGPAVRTPSVVEPIDRRAETIVKHEPAALEQVVSHVPPAAEAEVREIDAGRRTEGEEAAESTGTDRRGQVRVRTALLNELVNYAGEVSISRSRMEQQIFGLRENLAELNRNTTRFRDQIRDLEIQSESQIMARAQEVASQLGEDFDPLELDRFYRFADSVAKSCREPARSVHHSLQSRKLRQPGRDGADSAGAHQYRTAGRLDAHAHDQFCHARRAPETHRAPDGA